MSAITMRRKSGPKEASVLDLAKSKARGGKRSPATNGSGHGDDHIDVLKRRLNVLLTEHGGDLSEDDRSFATSIVYGSGLVFPTDQLRAENLLTSFERRNGKANGLQVTNSAPAVAGDELLPAETGATVPAGIARRNGAQRNGSHGRLSRENISHGRLSGEAMFELRDSLRANRPVPEDVAAAVEAGHEVELDCRRLQEHPDNRDSRDDDADIVKLAASIKELKQQQPILVRPTPAAARQVGGEKEFEVIFGERRWRACRVAGVKVRAKVRTDLTDAQVLELIGVENGLRKDLNPIERARHIEVLCRPLSELGGGKTLEEAAPIVGLKDPASASNCRRLLKLPKFFQDLVAAGELAETFARLLLPYAEATKLMDRIQADYEKAMKSRQAYDRECWETRAELEWHLKHLAIENTRPVDGKREHEYGYNQIGTWKGYPRLFELTDEIRKQLDIVTIPIDGKPVEVATDVKRFDKLQLPLVKAKHKPDIERKNSRPGKPAKQTEAQAKAAATKQAAENEKKRKEAVELWIHNWKASLVWEAISANQDHGAYERVVLALLTGGLDNWWPGDVTASAIGDVLKKHGVSASKRCENLWSDLGRVKPAGAANVYRDCCVAVVKALLLEPERYVHNPTLEPEKLGDLLQMCQVDLKAAWRELQNATRREHLKKLIDLFTGDSLDQFGTDCGCFLGQAKGRAAKHKLLFAKLPNLQMPAWISPSPAKPAKNGKR